MAPDGTFIVKRIKKAAHGAHHGGAWKVAYADFVTAMMAFFLLMWLINTTTPEQKRGIADYFAPQSVSQTSSGAGGVLGGKVLAPVGAQAGAVVTASQKKPPPAPPAQSHTRDKLKGQDGKADTDGKQAYSQPKSDDHLERAMPAAHDRDFEGAAESIREAIQEMPDIAALSR